MRPNWPPLDVHTHVDPAIDPTSLLSLRAVIFAASRSPEESARALCRQPSDPLTVWGVGVHPGLASALESYTVEAFQALIDRTGYVSEIGLDGRVPSRLSGQREVFASILDQLQTHPRVTAIHSYAATTEVITELTRTPIAGAILHWWLGDPETTKKAVELGAYFSVNVASLRRPELLDLIPIDRVLLETDHPDGNGHGSRPRQPGNVADVEAALADRHRIRRSDLRLKVWQNLAALVTTTKTADLLPPRVRAILDAARQTP